MGQAQNLSPELQRKLEQVITRYLRAVEAGMPVDREELLARHDELAEHLRAFFAAQDQQRPAPSCEDMADPDRAFSADGREPPTLRPRADVSDSPNEAKTLPPQEQDLKGGASRVVPSPDIRVRYFGDYELLEEIARGGMGVV